jgi:hypothetical protein
MSAQPDAESKAGSVRPTIRLVPAAIVLDRAATDLDVGLAATETVFGLIVGLLIFVLGTCWRITTPVWAVPPLESVTPIGSNPDGGLSSRRPPGSR